MKSLSIPFAKTINSWDQIEYLHDFSYPWRSESPPRTLFQAYHDDNYLYFKYTASCANPLVYVDTNHKLEVIHSERVEIFFRKDADLNPYYVFEIDPHGRVLDYEASYYRNFNREWAWPSDLKLKTKIHKDHYTVQGQFEKAQLKALGLLQDGVLQTGLYRGHCTALIEGKSEIKWISWIDSGTKEPDFHVASSFGKLILLPK